MTSKEAFEKTFGEYGINDAGYPIFRKGSEWEREEMVHLLRRFMSRHQNNGAYVNAARMILKTVQQRGRNERQ